MDFLRDCKIGWRNLKKHRKYSIIVLLTMVLGVSVTATVYSLINQVLLQPLPVPYPEQLITIDGRNLTTGEPSDYEWVDFPLFQQWQDLNLKGLDVVFFTFESSVLTENPTPVYATTLVVSHNFLSVLGVEPLHGRWFNKDDIGRNNIVLSYDIWARELGADPDIIGQAISVDKEPYNVIGVMPENFAHFLAPTAKIFRPVDSFYRGGEIFGRLTEGASFKQSQFYSNALTRVTKQNFPETEVYFYSLQERVTADASSNLWLLLAGVVALLLVAILNVVNLTFAYYTNRYQELSIRIALGATRNRLIKQLVTENLLMALAVAILSILVSVWLLDLVISIIGQSLPRRDEIAIDTHAWMFSFVLAIFASLIAALIPSLKIVQPKLLIDGIKQGNGRSTGSFKSVRLSRNLISLEVGFSLLLLISVALLTRSYLNLMDQDLGFNPNKVLTAHTWAPDNYGDKERISLFTSILNGIEEIPGIALAASTSTVPLGPIVTRLDFSEAYTYSGQQTLNSNSQPHVFLRTVSDNYFRVLNIPLLDGRFFDDREKGLNVKSAIVNKTMAEKNWSGESPIGKEIHITNWKEGGVFRIVGVVGDNLHTSVNSAVKPELFLSMSQVAFHGSTYVAKFDYGNPATIFKKMSEVVIGIDNSIPMIEPHSMEGLIADSIKKQKSLLQVLFGFSVVTIFLAMVGIYGLSNYLIGQRTSELAVRIAIGAKPKVIRRMLMVDSVKPVIVGIGLGLFASILLSRLIESFLFGIEVWDPTAYLSACGLILLTGFLAPAGPAMRASLISPSLALHHH